MVALNRIVAEGKTPSQVKEEMAARGIFISERTLRERAREKGACRIMGRTMILLPEHIDMIFEEPECHSKNTSAAKSGGFVEELRILTTTTDEALAHLTKLSQKPKSASSNPKRANVLSLDRMRRN